MADKEYKKFDSQDKYVGHNMRVCTQPNVFDGKEGKMVSFSICSESRRETGEGEDGNKPLWIKVNVTQRQGETAAKLQKGDSIGVEGKPIWRQYTTKEGEERAGMELEFAELKMAPSLLKELNERSGSSSKKAAPAKGKKTKAAPPPQDDDDDNIDNGDDLPF